MSNREKKLLILLGLAGFLIVNFFLYSLYAQKKVVYDSDLFAAKADLRQAIAFQNSSAELGAEMDWLEESEPEPAAYQTVQTDLQQFADQQARSLGLEVKGRDFLATDTSGDHYHRAQVKIKLTGRESNLYRWLHAVNDPTQFRAAYRLRLSPNSQEDTLIDCEATISQWFPPET